MQQTSSKLPANVLKIHVLKLDVCWTFARSILLTYLVALTLASKATCLALALASAITELENSGLSNSSLTLSYGASPAIWDHTALPATRYR